MGNLARIVVLAEDIRHQSFVRRYLYQLDYKTHDIRFESLPSGRGCGEQWVRQRYANAVAALNCRALGARGGLPGGRSAQYRRRADRAIRHAAPV